MTEQQLIDSAVEIFVNGFGSQHRAAIQVIAFDLLICCFFKHCLYLHVGRLT